MKKRIEFTRGAWDFYMEQSEKVKSAFKMRIDELSESGELNEPDAKKIAPNLYEIRVKVSPNQYRMFYCYVEPDAVLIVSGYVKKTRKAPIHEIDKAKRIKREAGVR